MYSYMYCRNCGWFTGDAHNDKTSIVSEYTDLFRTARERFLREGPPPASASLLGLPSDPREPYFEPLTFGIGRVTCSALPGLPGRFRRSQGSSLSDTPGLIFAGGHPEGLLNSCLIIDNEAGTAGWYIKNRRTDRFQFLMSPGYGPVRTVESLPEGVSLVRRQILLERSFTYPVLLDLPLPSPDSPVRIPSAAPLSSSVSLPPLHWDTLRHEATER